MKHQKMQYTYVGIDSHKDTHTAVFMDCFFEKLGEIVFDNLPYKFSDFLSQAKKLEQDGTTLLFGLEDVSVYGRQLTVFLTENNQPTKHVNAYLVAQERKSLSITQKTDSVDAECAARVLLSKLNELPDANPINKYWILRTLVVRRDFLIKNNVSLKYYLHDLLFAHFPRYGDVFVDPFCKTALAFFMRFPSPPALKGVTAEELFELIRGYSSNRIAFEKAEEILSIAAEGNFTGVEFQEVRDTIVQSAIRQMQTNLAEIESVEDSMAGFLEKFNCTLTSMTGIDVVRAAQLLSCIGDIKKFSTPAKLARYCGVAPVTYSSGKTEIQYANKRGNRELNSLFFCLAAFLVTTSIGGKATNPFFYDYYHKKQAEGKTKRQALKCIQRRLVNIIWTMLTNNEEYVNPPMIERLPEEKTEQTDVKH